MVQNDLLLYISIIDHFYYMSLNRSSICYRAISLRERQFLYLMVGTDNWLKNYCTPPPFHVLILKKDMNIDFHKCLQLYV